MSVSGPPSSPPSQQARATAGASVRLRHLLRQGLPLLTTLLVGLSGLTLVVLPRLLDPTAMPEPQIGVLVSEDIRAPRSLDIVDEETTDWMQKDAQASVRAVYDYDEELAAIVRQRVSEAFDFMRGPSDDAGALPGNTVFEQRKPEFLRLLGATLEDEDFADLRARRFDAVIERTIQEAVTAAFVGAETGAAAPGDPASASGPASGSGLGAASTPAAAPQAPSFIVSDKQLLLPDQGKGIIVRHVRNNTAASVGPAGDAEEVLRNLTEVRDVAAARADMASRLRELGAVTVVLSRAERRLVLAIADRLVKPNLVFNRDETERRRLRAASEIKKVTIPIQQGERIAKRGDRLTRRQVLVLKGFYAQAQRSKSASRAVGTTALLAIFALASLRFSRSLSKRPLRIRDGIFAIAVLVAQMLMVRGLSFALSFWDPSAPIPYEAFLWAAPFATGALLVRLFLAHEVGLVVGMVSAVAASIMFEGNFVLLLYVLSGSIVAATPTRKRNRLWQIGLEVALAQALVVLCHMVLTERFMASELGWASAAALTSGVLAALLCAVVTPILEALLGFTTEGRLKELASLNHPILKQLIVAAPGTYHHSIVMGQMVEAAAQDIGANPMLAKVGAYFHDIGKLDTPQLYSENRRHAARRDAQASIMSDDEWRAVRAHVEAGVRIARNARLGSAVIDIIMTHHGTRLIERATQALRYAGPKPRGKEATLVMLADAIEARVRGIEAEHEGQIAEIIEELVQQLMAAGELFESELALHDLPVVKAAFLRTLAKIRRAEDGQKLWLVHEHGGSDDARAAASKTPSRPARVERERKTDVD